MGQVSKMLILYEKYMKIYDILLKSDLVWIPEDKTNFGTSIGQFITNQI